MVGIMCTNIEQETGSVHSDSIPKTVRKYWRVEAQDRDGRSYLISSPVYTVKTAQKKARYHRNKTGEMSSVIEVTETVIVNTSMRVVNKYERQEPVKEDGVIKQT